MAPDPVHVERLVQAAVDQGHPRLISDPQTARKIATLLDPPVTPAPTRKAS